MRLPAFLEILFRGGTSSFNTFERMVLDGIRVMLLPELQGRFEARIRAINLVQRLDGGREVNCFSLVKGRATLDLETRIDDSNGEKVFATFSVEGPLGTRNSGKVWLVDGNLFSLEFEEPTEHARPETIRAVRCELCSQLTPAISDRG